MVESARKLIDESGFINPKAIAETFHTTIKEVAKLAGLSVEAISKKDRVRSKNSQKRLRDMVMVINRVTPWCGSVFQAYAWYRSESLPSLGDLTAEALVKQDKVDLVMRYIDRLAEGGYA